MPSIVDKSSVKMICVDDFALRKRFSYGTVMINLENHRIIDTLRDWLRNNKHIKVVTRDRASAYAKVISEELPDAMQVADRFHLHQNLLEAIKKALNHEVPATVEYSRAMKSHFRKFGNQMSGSGNHLCNYASLLA